MGGWILCTCLIVSSNTHSLVQSVLSPNHGHLIIIVLQQFNTRKWFILQITKQAADSYCSERWLPVCELAAQWEGEDEQPAPLHHEIDLIGAQPSTAYLSLDLEPKGKTAVGKIEGMEWK